MRSLRSVTLQPIDLALAQLEAGDRLLGLVTTGFWPEIGGQLGHRGLDLLGILGGFADAHVDDDLFELRHLHGVLVLELLQQGGADDPHRNVHANVQPLSCPPLTDRSLSPERLATRTLRPSSRILMPMRVGFLLLGIDVSDVGDVNGRLLLH